MTKLELQEELKLFDDSIEIYIHGESGIHPLLLEVEYHQKEGTGFLVFVSAQSWSIKDE
jgi:hypothetical protein